MTHDNGAYVKEAIAADRRRLLGEVEAMRRYTNQCRSRGTTIWVPLLDVQLLLQADPFAGGADPCESDCGDLNCHFCEPNAR